MLEFTKPIKIYLFKDRQLVSLGLRVSDSCVNTYDLPVTDFEKILGFWNKKGGCQLTINDAVWNVQYKTSGPRPECKSVSYVRIAIYYANRSYHYRLDYNDMYEVIKDYYYQKNNKMYWDKDEY